VGADGADLHAGSLAETTRGGQGQGREKGAGGGGRLLSVTVGLGETVSVTQGCGVVV
jgi:hypothetical protein